MFLHNDHIILYAVSVVLFILQKGTADADSGDGDEVIRSKKMLNYLAFVAAIAAAAAIWGIIVRCSVTCCRRPVGRIPVCCPHRSLCAFCQHISSFWSWFRVLRATNGVGVETPNVESHYDYDSKCISRI